LRDLFPDLSPYESFRLRVSPLHELHVEQAGNPNGKPNGDVIRPWVNGADFTGRCRSRWIIDFPPGMSAEEAAKYERPFEYVKAHVKPLRDTSKRRPYREKWWIHAEACVAMREAIKGLRRFLVSPVLTKHRLFVWCKPPTLPDHQLVVFARDDDYFFGVLHSRVHEVWALLMGTQLEDRPRYTPTTCFQTFPLPHASPEQQTAIAEAAKELDRLRQGWLNPPEDSIAPSELKKRTLTNLYNQRPTWLVNAHRKLDEAVFAAYGWPEAPDSLPDSEIVKRLLAMNLQREAVE